MKIGFWQIGESPRSPDRFAARGAEEGCDASPGAAYPPSYRNRPIFVSVIVVARRRTLAQIGLHAYTTWGGQVQSWCYRCKLRKFASESSVSITEKCARPALFLLIICNHTKERRKSIERFILYHFQKSHCQNFPPVLESVHTGHFSSRMCHVASRTTISFGDNTRCFFAD